MDVLYVRSPYIQIIRKNDIKIRIYNHVTRQLNNISIDEYIYLDTYRTPSTIKNKEYSESLVQKKLLIPYQNMWNQLTFHRIEIETSTVCNWKCEFCPGRTMERKAQHIDKNLYRHILDKAIDYGSIKYVVLHGFNEPTIDPHFLFYVEELISRGFQLVLFTNGTGLTDEKIEFFKIN